MSIHRQVASSGRVVVPLRGTIRPTARRTSQRTARHALLDFAQLAVSGAGHHHAKHKRQYVAIPATTISFSSLDISVLMCTILPTGRPRAALGEALFFGSLAADRSIDADGAPVAAASRRGQRPSSSTYIRS